ncbi:MAG: AAA family ATPase [Candidatus Bathyarchaeota archaeon]|nr:AAA family ATPase [Candidatus Termiticorpusculum sp.]
MSHVSVFKDESKLDINYLPVRILHRDLENRLLMEFFSFLTHCPDRMSQRVLVVGEVGTGKTVFCQVFGRSISVEMGKRGIKFRYIHVNCREYRGNLLQILHQVIVGFQPNFPSRGYSIGEILKSLLQLFESEQVFVVLALDEFDSLIEKEGSDAVYELTRIQEMCQGKPHRVSFIFIQRRLSALKVLDDSAQSTLQSNVIRLERYGKESLVDILGERVRLAFEVGVVAEDVVELVAELAASKLGNARFGIELLWRSGKYADAQGVKCVEPECVRQAVSAILPTFKRNEVNGLELHEKFLLLAVARFFKESKEAFASLVEIEDVYGVVCEEYGQAPYSHTQVWKYLQQFAQKGIVNAEVVSGVSRGRSTRVSLPLVSAVVLERELFELLEMEFGS